MYNLTWVSFKCTCPFSVGGKEPSFFRLSVLRFGEIYSGFFSIRKFLRGFDLRFNFYRFYSRYILLFFTISSDCRRLGLKLIYLFTLLPGVHSFPTRRSSDLSVTQLWRNDCRFLTGLKPCKNHGFCDWNLTYNTVYLVVLICLWNVCGIVRDLARSWPSGSSQDFTFTLRLLSSVTNIPNVPKLGQFSSWSPSFFIHSFSFTNFATLVAGKINWFIVNFTWPQEQRNCCKTSILNFHLRTWGFLVVLLLWNNFCCLHCCILSSWQIGIIKNTHLSAMSDTGKLNVGEKRGRGRPPKPKTEEVGLLCIISILKILFFTEFDNFRLPLSKHIWLRIVKANIHYHTTWPISKPYFMVLEKKCIDYIFICLVSV